MLVSDGLVDRVISLQYACTFINFAMHAHICGMKSSGCLLRIRAGYRGLGVHQLVLRPESHNFCYSIEINAKVFVKSQPIC